MKRNEEITDGSRKPTKRQIEILEQLSKQGELNPNRLAGIINILNWFQNSHARNRRKQQKDLMQELSLNQRVGEALLRLQYAPLELMVNYILFSFDFEYSKRFS